MSDDTVVVNKVRAAIKDRGLYLALLYRSYSKALPAEQAEKLAREAIFEYGRVRGRADSGPVTPESWVDYHMAKGSGAIFESRIEKGDGYSVQEMHYCPLMEAWHELGCSDAEMDLLCDIAMEVDRGRAAYHGLTVDMPKRMGKGDSCCQLVLRRDS